MDKGIDRRKGGISGSKGGGVQIVSSQENRTGTPATSSSSPDPSKTTAGTLFDTTSATTYQPAAGLSSRTVTTVTTVTTVPGAFTQTTDTYLDGRTASTTGDLYIGTVPLWSRCAASAAKPIPTGNCLEGEGGFGGIYEEKVRTLFSNSSPTGKVS